MSETGKLTATQHKAIAALLTCASVRQASKQSGVAERTLHRWMQDAAFQAALTDAQSRAVQAHVTALIAQLADNRQAMIAIRDGAQHESTRLRASIAIDDSLIKWRSLAEFEQRLARLEREIASET